MGCAVTQPRRQRSDGAGACPRAPQTSLSARMALIGASLPHTPLMPLIVRSELRPGTLIYLKREDLGRWGSIKDRTAVSLVRDALRRRPDVCELVESTSGNLGVAVAAVAAELGLAFTAVLDPRTPPLLVARLRELGAAVAMASRADEHGSFLAARIELASRLAGSKSRAMWLDQYNNPANPAAHRDITGPEIFDQLGGAPRTIFASVSTGGTARGLSDFFAAHSTVVVAVDVVGSVALGGRPASRTMTGIGSSRRSAFLADCPSVVRCLVAESDAADTCRAVWAETGLMLGGSSGAALAACSRAIADGSAQQPIVCVCPDGGSPYAESIYGGAPRDAIADASRHTAPSRARYDLAIGSRC